MVDGCWVGVEGGTMKQGDVTSEDQAILPSEIRTEVESVVLPELIRSRSFR